jgi:hypothetical protein
VITSSFTLYYYSFCDFLFVGRNSSTGIAKRYGLDGPGIESLCGRDFPNPSTPSLGPTKSPVKWVLSVPPGGKAAGVWR